MKCPVARKPCRLTQGFKPGAHLGIDIINYAYDNVFAIVDSVFLDSHVLSGLDQYGNAWILLKGLEEMSNLHFLYVHNYCFSILNKNEMIMEGVPIGYTILGGNARGAHLHFGIFNTTMNEWVDPEIFFKAYNFLYSYWKEGDKI